MAPTTDIKMRGSGELLFRIKSKDLSGQDVLVYANLIWTANQKGEVTTCEFSDCSIKRLIALKFIAQIDARTCLLNPHVAQIGKTSIERGQIRKRFRSLVGG